MRSPASRTADLAARLASVGCVPDVQERGDHWLVEADLPGGLSRTSWRDLLATLEAADWSGHSVSSHTHTLWAGINKEAPTTAPAVRGHGHQLEGAD